MVATSADESVTRSGFERVSNLIEAAEAVSNRRGLTENPVLLNRCGFDAGYAVRSLQSKESASDVVTLVHLKATAR